MIKYYISNSKIHGRGIFANKNMKKDELIFVFKGIKLKKVPGPWQVGPNWLQVDIKTWVKPKENSPGRYLNHSCNPNAGIKGNQLIVAIKNIKKGQEITIDYSMSETEPQWKMKCSCKSKNCRKIIRTYQHLPNKIKKKYKGYISKYIKTKRR